ncbi:MAG: ABC transporter substrate-binding protein [Clostridia bacterium]|nr:ABC transporter substrate-binding protein [Clostridia bacterium]
MKKLVALLLTLALCLSAGALATPTEDRAGEPIKLPEAVEKIVSMAPSTTRVLTDLGLADRLLAVDTYSAGYQPELASLPQFDMMAPDTEQLAALQPDVIFITGMSLVGGDNPYQALIDLGIAVVQIPSSSSIADIQQDVLFIGECVGAQEKAQALVDDMQAAIDEIAAIGATVTEKKRVAVEVAALPYLCYAGGNTYLDEMLRLIGAENAYGDGEPWASVTEEAAVAANPDVILTCISYLDDPVGEILGREGWGEVAAIANGQVYRLDDESSNQPNHRIVIALRQMAEAVYPEVYGALDAAA